MPKLPSSRRDSRVGTSALGKTTHIWDLRDGLDIIGQSYLKLGGRLEAAEYLREALPLSEALNRDQPNHSMFATMFAESKARLGEALLALGQVDQAQLLL